MDGKGIVYEPTRNPLCTPMREQGGGETMDLDNLHLSSPMPPPSYE